MLNERGAAHCGGNNPILIPFLIVIPPKSVPGIGAAESGAITADFALCAMLARDGP